MKYTKKDLTQSLNRLNNLVDSLIYEFDPLGRKYTFKQKGFKNNLKFEIMKYLYDHENEFRLINNELSKDFRMGFDPELKNDEFFIYEKIDKLIDCSNEIYKKNQIDNINKNHKRYLKGVK